MSLTAAGLSVIASYIRSGSDRQERLRALAWPRVNKTMTPTINFCSWLAGRCFTLNVDAVPASYQACEEAMTQVVSLSPALSGRGILPADLFIYERECIS